MRLQDWFEDQISKMGIAPKKIKLNVKAPTSLKLRFGTPASTSTPGPAGGSIDNDSLRRQREETGQAMIRAQSIDKKTGGTPVPSIISNGARSMSAVATPGPAEGQTVDEETKGASQTAQLADTQQPPTSQQLQTSTMQPPHPATGAPVPGSHFGGSITLGQAPAPKNALERDSPFDRVMRDPGKGQSLLRHKKASSLTLHQQACKTPS